MVRVRCTHSKTTVRRRLQALSTHQFLDRRPANFETTVNQLFMHSRTAVNVFVTFRMNAQLPGRQNGKNARPATEAWEDAELLAQPR